jgi:phosphatidylinositol 3-kinase
VPPYPHFAQEFVCDSATVTHVTNGGGSILAYFESAAKKAAERKGTDQAEEMKLTLEKYVRSLAGYAVLTYVFGVGDRHYENLMLCEDGRFFHLDFGWIMGFDPKPELMVMPVAISPEMYAIIAMDHDRERLFKSYCFQGFNVLRKSANLIINLIALMLDSGIPHLSGTEDSIILKVPCSL